MHTAEFYGAGFPYNPVKELEGKLIVLEGTDGVGRSTQIQLLRRWLEDEGYAVSDTGFRRSPLTQAGLESARTGHTLSPLTMSYFYATDFADRLENQIIPALKAGFVVLSDRYFYSVMARDIVRGADRDRERSLYGFALKPDLVMYLRADVDTLIARLVHGRGFDYWESGMDIRCADNIYDSFVSYQGRLLEEFDKMAGEYAFVTIDATRPIQTVTTDLKLQIKQLFERLPE